MGLRFAKELRFGVGEEAPQRPKGPGRFAQTVEILRGPVDGVATRLRRLQHRRTENRFASRRIEVANLITSIRVRARRMDALGQVSDTSSIAGRLEEWNRCLKNAQTHEEIREVKDPAIELKRQLDLQLERRGILQRKDPQAGEELE